MNDINYDELKATIQRRISYDFWERFKKVLPFNQSKIDGHKFEDWVKPLRFGDHNGISKSEWNKIYDIFCK